MATPRVKQRAHTIIDMVESGKYTSVVWSWDFIGGALGISKGQAQEVVYYLRQHHDEFYFTVGTLAAPMRPTRNAVDALPGIVNQYRHSYTRDLSSARVWEVLATIDPDPAWAAFAQRETRFMARRAEDMRDHIEYLMERGAM